MQRSKEIESISSQNKFNFNSDLKCLSKIDLYKDHTDLLIKMGYWDEDLKGNPYPFERHLSFFCCSGKLPLKYVLYPVGGFGFVKLMMSMISAGCGKCNKNL